jgi:hypothetical protein
VKRRKNGSGDMHNKGTKEHETKRSARPKRETDSNNNNDSGNLLIFCSMLINDLIK